MKGWNREATVIFTQFSVLNLKILLLYCTVTRVTIRKVLSKFICNYVGINTSVNIYSLALLFEF